MMKIFTDGSVTGKEGGWSYIVRNSGKIKTKDSYEAELMAIVMAAESASASFCLVTDHWNISKSLRHMIENPSDKLPHHYPELWQRIHDRLPLIKGVEWMKRCSTPEMRLADRLAGEAYSSEVEVTKANRKGAKR